MPLKPFTYDWSQFTLKIEIHCSPEQVFRAWTDEQELVKWFSVKAELEPKKGGLLYFEWLGGDRLETKIVRVVKNRLVQFPFGSHGEQVEVTIRKEKHTTICQLHQFQMRTTPTDKVRMHMGCKEGWTFFLTNLKAYLEHGLDLRSHDPEKSYKTGFINS